MEYLDEAKPAGSEQRAAGSGQQFELQTDSRRMAVGTRQQESKYKRVVGKNQTAASSKKSTPPTEFSKFRYSWCILLTAICLLVSLCVLAFRPVGPTARRARKVLSVF